MPTSTKWLSHLRGTAIAVAATAATVALVADEIAYTLAARRRHRTVLPGRVRTAHAGGESSR